MPNCRNLFSFDLPLTCLPIPSHQMTHHHQSINQSTINQSIDSLTHLAAPWPPPGGSHTQNYIHIYRKSVSENKKIGARIARPHTLAMPCCRRYPAVSFLHNVSDFAPTNHRLKEHSRRL
jgi:hypothetical protein